jgi:membrane protein
VVERLRPFAGAARRMVDYELTGRAAELAYYSMLAVFPALAMLVAAVGLFASTEDVDRLIAALAADEGARGAITGIVEADTGASLALGGGLLTTAYSASLYTAAFTRGAAAAHGQPVARVALRRRLWLMPVTVAALLALGVALGLLLLTGSAVGGIAGVVGLGGLTGGLLAVARWPVLVGVLLMLAYALFQLGPADRRSRRPTLGAVVAVAAWLAASLGFALWTATLATYESTYGALGGVVSFLVWLWLSNLALLYGVALDAELRDE